MKFSVIVPGFGKDRSLAEAQAVRLSGIVGGDAEVLVPDGSNVAEARNNGLRAARGEWIVWVDADDEVTADWFPEISRAIAAAERDGTVDDIILDMTVVTGARETLCRYGRGYLVDPKVVVSDMLRDMRLGAHCWRHVMSRRLWEGDSFDGLPILEDYVTLPRVLARARKIAYLDKPLYRYVVRNGSLCKSGEEGRHAALDTAARRARSAGGPANVGAMVCAYGILYDRLDADGTARRLIRRYLLQALCDSEVGCKWKLKFALAAIGIIVRRPK